MISTFDLSKLRSLLEDFYRLTQIRITVFDDSFRELAAYPEQIPSFCRLIRTDSEGAARCHLCDERACAIAAKRRSFYTYQCHAGLTETITPIRLGNIVIGYLLFGHIFSYSSHEEGWSVIEKLCDSYHLNRTEFKSACFERPLISREYIASASRILQGVASYLCMDRMVSLRQQELPVQIDEYISAHFTEPISADTLCQRFHIGKTRLYEISKQNYGIGIAEHIRNLRIEKAKDLLSSEQNLSLSEISSLCGFPDYNYFITVFKRITGYSPRQYARQKSE